MQTRMARRETCVLSGDLSFLDANPFVCFAEGDLPADPPAKTFTQEQLDAILKDRLAKEERSLRAKIEADVKTKSEQTTTELQKRIEELELQGKTAAEREAIERDRSAKAAAKQIEERDAAARKQIEELTNGKAASDAKLRNHLVRGALGNALMKSNINASALPDALAVFSSEAKVDLDDEGNVSAITYGGVAHKTPDDAAKAFLKQRTYFLPPTRGNGTGLDQPRGQQGAPKAEDASPEELIAAGMRARKGASGSSEQHPMDSSD